MDKETVWTFVKRAGVAVGSALTIGGYIVNAIDLADRVLGLPIAAWQAIGASLFMAGIAGIVFWHKKQPFSNSNKQENSLDPKDSGQANLESSEIRVLAEEDIRFEGPNGDIQAWYLKLQDLSQDTDAQDVEVKVEYRDKIDNILQPKERSSLIVESGVVLKFENGAERLTIHRGDHACVRLVSFCKTVPKRWIQIGEYSEHVFDNRDKIVSGMHEPNRLDVVVRSKNAKSVHVSFLVQVEHELLTVKMLP